MILEVSGCPDVWAGSSVGTNVAVGSGSGVAVAGTVSFVGGAGVGSRAAPPPQATRSGNTHSADQNPRNARGWFIILSNYLGIAWSARYAGRRL